MAGIGIKLNKLFDNSGITGHVAGAGYSVMTTIAPMLLIMADLIVMQRILGYEDAGYTARQLFQSTILYIFIFSLLASSPLNAVLSRYISDVIFEEHYDDIMPCFYFGLALNLFIDFIIAFPFALHEYFVGGVALLYVSVSFSCFMILSFIFYTML
jgi:uncharacterized membrane protein